MALNRGLREVIFNSEKQRLDRGTYIEAFVVTSLQVCTKPAEMCEYYLDFPEKKG
jgi:hypothetical protein